MRIPILLVTLAALALSACDSRDDAPTPLPAGVSATVDGQPFRASLTMGWRLGEGDQAMLALSGARIGTDGMHMILLTVPPRVGTYTAAHAEVSAAYMRSGVADTTSQMWLAGAEMAGTTLEIRVAAVSNGHAEGTFAFTARPEDPALSPVVVTGGTFNLAVGEMPNERAPGAILDAKRAFERAQPRPSAR